MRLVSPVLAAVALLALGGCTSITSIQPSSVAPGERVLVGVANVIGPYELEPGIRLKFDHQVMELEPNTDTQVGFRVPEGTKPGTYLIEIRDMIGALEFHTVLPMLRWRTDRAMIRVVSRGTAERQPRRPDAEIAAAPGPWSAPLQTAARPPPEVPKHNIPASLVLAGTSATGPPAVERRLVVKEGDSLWRIAQRVYGAGRHYRDIVAANRGAITNPDHIRPGQVLVLPARILAASGPSPPAG